MKKLILVLLILFPLMSSAAVGDLIKAEGFSTIYRIEEDGKRHTFPTFNIYKSWYGENFGNVMELSVDNVSKYELGNNVMFKSGSLIKIPTVPKVYLVGENGQLEWIRTEEEFYSRGFKFSDVKDLPEVFFFGSYQETAASKASSSSSPLVKLPSVDMSNPIIIEDTNPTPAPVSAAEPMSDFDKYYSVINNFNTTSCPGRQSLYQTGSFSNGLPFAIHSSFCLHYAEDWNFFGPWGNSISVGIEGRFFPFTWLKEKQYIPKTLNDVSLMQEEFWCDFSQMGSDKGHPTTYKNPEDGVAFSENCVSVKAKLAELGYK